MDWKILPREPAPEGRAALERALDTRANAIIDEENGDDPGTAAKSAAWDVCAKGFPALHDAAPSEATVCLARLLWLIRNEVSECQRRGFSDVAVERSALQAKIADRCPGLLEWASRGETGP